jgi:hypothetical protein
MHTKIDVDPPDPHHHGRADFALANPKMGLDLRIPNSKSVMGTRVPQDIGANSHDPNEHASGTGLDLRIIPRPVLYNVIASEIQAI